MGWLNASAATTSTAWGASTTRDGEWLTACMRLSLWTTMTTSEAKVAVAFMLGHDYGFKRIMSSYYFQDTDQGPPGGAPASFPNACGNGWTCEHRWSSIMNMAQFANKVIGQPVTNWDASGTTLGFARGNVGFLALGDLGKEFNTGLPDGKYCDIIRDCSQKIQISGGRGYFQSPDQDPVVAICVGC